MKIYKIIGKVIARGIPPFERQPDMQLQEGQMAIDASTQSRMSCTHPTLAVLSIVSPLEEQVHNEEVGRTTPERFGCCGVGAPRNPDVTSNVQAAQDGLSLCSQLLKII